MSVSEIVRAERAPAPEVIRLTGVEQLGSRIDAWRELAAHIDGSSYFQTPDWVLNWWEDAGRPPAEVAFWRSASGTLEAVAYLARMTERLVHQLPMTVRFTTNLGSGRPHSADRCGFPALPHRVPDVQRWVASHHWQDTLVLRHLDHDTGVPFVPPAAKLVLATPCPRLCMRTDTQRTQRSKNFRKQIARYQRKIEAQGVSFIWVPPEAMTCDAIDTLFTLNESRRSLTGTSSFRRERSAEFHRRLVRWSAPGRGPAMVLAMQEGRPIGTEYGFVWRDMFYYYQGGWYAGWAKHSLGSVLTSEAIRLTHLQGLRCVDFLRGREPYKYRFGAADQVDESWVVPRGVGGWLITRKFQVVALQRAWQERRRRTGRDAVRGSMPEESDR